jgi:hypothetical protein
VADDDADAHERHEQPHRRDGGVVRRRVAQRHPRRRPEPHHPSPPPPHHSRPKHSIRFPPSLAFASKAHRPPARPTDRTQPC